ncbi:MAG: SDR family NAD(P)-dependent oxidoreductase [Alphaproteobacteria bacterium]|nr:SDR family NAD(P)-dependent oxidoreductase [Alphaproteobacteria bacterium]
MAADAGGSGYPRETLSSPDSRTWAIVAGASEGLGEAFAEALARRGHPLVLIARRADRLEAVRERLSAQVEVRIEVRDLAEPGLAAFLQQLADELDIGIAVYNAAFAPIGGFLERPLDDLLAAVDVNVRGPLIFARTLAPGMVARGRGGLVLLGSLAGFQGAPRIATYAATKAFDIVLGEGLWAELQPHGVDVLVSACGAVRTPGYARSAGGDAPGTLDASDVAERTLNALGRGPTLVPGFVNQLARVVMGRLLPRRAAVALMARNTRELA